MNKQNILMVSLICLGMFLFISGCAPVQLDTGNTTLRPKEQVRFEVGEVEVINEARIENINTSQSSLFSARQIQISVKEIHQRQFHSIVVRFLNDLIVSDQGSEGKAVVRIDRAICIRCSPPLEGAPIFGLLTVGDKRTWISIISGDVEIENEQGHIIKRVGFNVKSQIERKWEWDGNEVVKFLNELIRLTLPRLEKEIQNLKDELW